MNKNNSLCPISEELRAPDPVHSHWPDCLHRLPTDSIPNFLLFSNFCNSLEPFFLSIPITFEGSDYSFFTWSCTFSNCYLLFPYFVLQASENKGLYPILLWATQCLSVLCLTNLAWRCHIECVSIAHDLLYTSPYYAVL